MVPAAGAYAPQPAQAAQLPHGGPAPDVAALHERSRTQPPADLFTAAVDSAAVYVNCSTRFTDGGEFGLGCEMGISTQKLHARGPMGLAELCSYKYIIHGNGQIR